MSAISKIATFLHRSADEAKKLNNPRVDRQRFLIFITLLASITLLFAFVLCKEILIWSKAKPNIPISRSKWHYVFEQQDNSDELASRHQSLPILADPNNPLLWESTQSLSVFKKKIKYSNGKPIWLGTTISTEDLQHAHKLEANYLILGMPKGDFTLWLDGAYYAQGKRKDHEPIVLTLPISRLLSKTPLKIALKVTSEYGTSFPEIFMNDFGQGLADATNKVGFLNMLEFSKKARPLSFFFINIIWGILFFLFWAYSTEKQEYFYMAIFALINGLVQLKKVDMFQGHISIIHSHSVHIVLRTLEGTFCLMLGLSYARSKQIFFKVGIPFILLTASIISFSIHDEGTKINIYTFLDHWASTIGCTIGALVCLLQAYHLNSIKDKDTYFNGRIHRLLLLSLGFLIATLFYHYTLYTNNGRLSDISRIITYSRIGETILVFYFFGLVILDFKDQKKLLEKTPISKYHRRTSLPVKVSGALLTVDLKNSEQLFNLGAQIGESGKLVETCLTHMWTAILNNQGTILATEGDLLRAFFDQDECTSPILSAILSTNEMTKYLALLQEQFESHSSVSTGIAKITFRGSIATGEIRPIWQTVGDIHYASWIEAGSSHPFLVSARLMELERNFDSPPPKSQVTILEKDLALVPKIHLDQLSGTWTLRDTSATGKHGKQYKIALYVPKSFFEQS